MAKSKLTYMVRRGIIEDLLAGIEPEIVARTYNVKISSVLARKRKIDRGELDLNIFEAQEILNASKRAKKEGKMISPIAKSPHPKLGKVMVKY